MPRSPSCKVRCCFIGWVVRGFVHHMWECSCRQTDDADANYQTLCATGTGLTDQDRTNRFVRVAAGTARAAGASGLLRPLPAVGR